MTTCLIFAAVVALADPDFKPVQEKLPVPAPKGATVLLDEKAYDRAMARALERGG